VTTTRTLRSVVPARDRRDGTAAVRRTRCAVAVTIERDGKPVVLELAVERLLP